MTKKILPRHRYNVFQPCQRYTLCQDTSGSQKCILYTYVNQLWIRGTFLVYELTWTLNTGLNKQDRHAETKECIYLVMVEWLMKF